MNARGNAAGPKVRPRTVVVLVLAVAGGLVSCSSLAVSSAVTPPAAPAPSSTPDAAEALPSADVGTCLLRNAIVPIAPANLGHEPPASAVLEVAARTLQHDLLNAHAAAIATVDRTTDDSGAVTGLRVSLSQGSQFDADAAVSAAVAALPAMYSDAVASAPIEIEESESPVTFADLCDGMQRIMDETTSGGDLVSVGIDTAAGRLVVGSLGSPEPVVEEVRSSLQGALDVVAATRDAPATMESEG
ncbi:zona occludens toxin (predicted ATPase) [Agrococcus sp. UYP33]